MASTVSLFMLLQQAAVGDVRHGHSTVLQVRIYEGSTMRNVGQHDRGWYTLEDKHGACKGARYRLLSSFKGPLSGSILTFPECSLVVVLVPVKTGMLSRDLIQILFEMILAMPSLSRHIHHSYIYKHM